MVVQAFVHRRCSSGSDEMVGAGDVEHQRVGDGVLLAEQAVDPDRIIADAGVDVGARRGHEGEPAAQAIADAADLAAFRRAGRGRRGSSPRCR